ncbi:hypothetical protein ACHAWU_001772 [Discostella pseudostelligera]|uniref:Uncharacterized protein n=1 Tax=Discostella pseudostelligera TaxID=259834 RepID=A0ABD3M7N2_9STRA
MTNSYGAIDGYESVGTQPQQHNPAERSRSKPWIIIAGVVLCIVVIFNNPWASSSASLHLVPNNLDSDDDDAASADFTDENRALFYHDQLVDHFNASDTSTWSNRYYASTEYFKGPGHPIFLIVGGEGSLDHGMLYPFVTQHLAPYFGAAVIEIEHRFYGPYQPIVGRKATVEELIELLTPQQAMADMVRLASVFKDRIDCSSHRPSTEYCPVISVGGSYPGFLSAMFRLVYPNFVDISYAASAPLKLYDQSADPYVYYDIVTKAAERLSPGCAHAVRTTLREAKKLIELLPSVQDAVKSMNMCVDKVPEYITNVTKLSEEVMTAVSFIFADYNMDAYPPGPDLGLYKACQVFQENKTKSPLEKVTNFFQLSRELDEEKSADEDTCYDISLLLTDSDVSGNTTTEWSDAIDGNMWDFQLCTTLIDPIGVSSDSMFPPRKWSYEDLTEYCHREYGQSVTPQPFALVQNLGFDKLDESDASYILFTNGIQDMWSGGSYLEDLSDTILALNFENGAHHSDLSHVGPSENDTEDIREGFVKISNILERWLHEIRNQYN